jgi:hypothetical protein
MVKSITDEKILELLDDFGYEVLDEDDKDPEYWAENFVEYFEEKVSRKACKISYGATRMAFIRNDCDYVLKVDLPFCSMPYNQLELKAYEDAETYGVQKILLPVKRIHTFDDERSVIWQPRHQFELRCEPKDHRRSVENKTMWSTKRPRAGILREEMPQCRRINTTWWARAYQIYGKRFMRLLVDWARENDVTDLHGANVGYYKNRPCIFDYAGYHD